MDTRNLGYLGGGVLVAVIIATLVGVPPAIWIPGLVFAAAVGLVIVVRQARADGSAVADRIVARATADVPATLPNAAEPSSPPGADVSVELVRAAGPSGRPAVWFHRRGGRRVHRYEGAAGWVVEQVSTKDPDNPRKRVIGESLTFASEAEAAAAADALARGTAKAAIAPERSLLNPA